MYMKKIVDLVKLQKRVSEARLEGKTIVLANGCFDVIHVDHIRYLEGAKALGNLLVVGINSDDSVRQLEGLHRPILPQEQRCELVAAVCYVDFVVVFHEPDVTALITAVRPHFHAKGTDYTEVMVPERDHILKHEGQVRIVGDAKQHSTRDLIAMVRLKHRRS